MMGGQLCTQVVLLATMGRLEKTTLAGRYALLAMASIARDRETDRVPAGIYFGGWEVLARAMGYPTYGPAAHRAVGRAIAELVDVGVLEAVEMPRPGRRQAYRLLLRDPLTPLPPQPVDNGDDD